MAGHAWDVMPKEGIKAYRAFRMYLALGPKRSIHQVARDLNVGVPGVSKWSRVFKWTKRVLAVEEAITQALVDTYTGQVKTNQEQITNDALRDYEEMLELWRIMMADYREKSVSDPTAITPDSLTKLASTRRTIDDVGRRATGLPGSIKEGSARDSVQQMPQLKQLTFLNGVARKPHQLESGKPKEHDDSEVPE